MTRRTTRADSATAAVDAFRSVALGVIEPPETVKLREIDRPVWDSIVRARAREEWGEVDLHHAANLARCLSDVERISAEIAKDGDVLTNDRGTQIVNPKHALLETLSRRSVALTRLLHLHAATLMRPVDAVAARETERKAREALQDNDDGDLLATPTVQ